MLPKITPIRPGMSAEKKWPKFPWCKFRNWRTYCKKNNLVIFLFWKCCLFFVRLCTGCYVSVVEEGCSTRPVGQCMYPWKTLVWVAQLNEILFEGVFFYFTRYREDRELYAFLPRHQGAKNHVIEIPLTHGIQRPIPKL